jgi:K+-transporting ATPase KdpF subunit
VASCAFAREGCSRIPARYRGESSLCGILECLAIGVAFFAIAIALREGLQPAGQASEEGAGKVIEPILLIFVIVLLMAYLVFALLRPEKF